MHHYFYELTSNLYSLTGVVEFEGPINSSNTLKEIKKAIGNSLRRGNLDSWRISQLSYLGSDNIDEKYNQLKAEYDDLVRFKMATDIHIATILYRLSHVEESESGNLFHPTTIASCRIEDGEDIRASITALMQVICRGKPEGVSYIDYLRTFGVEDD